ncbi:MAG: glycoside hydrolase family 3 N-terminal domain-containing protein [Actinomycetaceae bacterium]|nr:glycoside hydrolase family 3 N-terminal domain-containing protein [Actinomycetaceae bacterium]
MRPWNDPSASIDERVTALLSQMNLTEKIHQLGSYWDRPEEEAAPAPEPTMAATPAPNPSELNLDAPTAAAPAAPAGPAEDDEPQAMDSAFLDDRLSWDDTIKDGLGHLTRIWGSAPLTVADGAKKLRDVQAQVRKTNAFGLPALVHEECLTGFTALGATVYPAAIAWGATWNPDLIEKMAARIGEDMAAVGVHQGLSPLLDVVRDYRWGRVEETCGEDPYLVGTLGTAYVRGLQGAGVDATLKHFVAYPASKGGRNHAPVPMGPRELEDVMLPPFEMAVREGKVRSVMNSYSDIDGAPAASSHHLLTHVLRERWGFDGVVVSDYWSVRFLNMVHRVAADLTEAGALALKAGLDVELPETTCYDLLEEAVQRGLLSEEEIDTAVRRVLTQKARHGLLDENWQVSVDDKHDLDSAANREVAADMARESVVLLSNNGILPLKRESKVAVIGPVFDEVRSFMGCYAFPNHVLSRFEDHGTGMDITSLKDALPGIVDTEPVFVRGTGFTEGDDEGIAEAVAAAEKAEVAIVTVGDLAGLFGTGTSGEGCDVADLGLPGRQAELVEAVLATGTPTILVLVTGRPYSIGSFAPRCAAVIQAFMPGVEGAEAISGVISGDINPSGKLPIGIPDTPGGQPGTYLAPILGWVNAGMSNINPQPLFHFGHGLSYTSFEYSDATLSAQTMPLDGSVEYSLTVTNTGDRSGADVIQLYASDPWAEVVRPIKQLIGFTKVELEAGESARVTFTVHADRLSFIGADYQRIVEGGEIELYAGHSSIDTLAPSVLTLDAGRRIVGEGRVLVTPVLVEKK